MRFIITLIYGFWICAVAQHVSKEERSMQLVLELQQIELDNALNALHEADARYRQMKELQQKGIITLDELKKNETLYKEALASYKKQQIELENTNLEFLENASAISVIQAQKYKESGNREMVRISIRNDSNLEQAKMASSLDEAGLKELLRLKNIRIALLADGVQVGNPYEISVPELGYKKVTDIYFELRQRGLASIQLEMRYLNQCDRRNLFLEMGAASNLITVNCQQFSQEGALGNTVVYDLNLERLAEDEAVYVVRTIGLDPALRYTVSIDDKQVSYIKFSMGISRLAVQLNVFVPENIDRNLLDKDMSFYAVAAIKEDLDLLLARTPVPDERTMGKENLGFEKLIITPRGTADIGLYVANMRTEVVSGDRASLQMNLINEGTVPLHKVHFETVAPFGWKTGADPAIITDFSAADQVQAVLEIIPPGDVVPGKYEIQLNAVSEYQNETVSSSEKMISVEVKGRRGFWGGFFLVTALIGVLGGVTFFTLKVSKR